MNQANGRFTTHRCREAGVSVGMESSGKRANPCEGEGFIRGPNKESSRTGVQESVSQ